MSTPIEIVREQMHAERARYNYCATSAGAEYYTALASVLADAERFQALEQLTWGCDHMIGMSRRKDDHMLVWGEGKTLAELADKLRSETK